MKIKSALGWLNKKLFCKHKEADLTSWQWTHGQSGNEHAFVIADYKCKWCGKTIQIHLHGKEAIEFASVIGFHKYRNICR